MNNIYAIGPGYWDFESAYEAAGDGDILEFMKDAYYEQGADRMYNIRKDITIRGYYEIGEDGVKYFFSTFIGKINIPDGNKVRIENMQLCTNGNKNAVAVGKDSSVELEHILLSYNYEGYNTSLICVVGGSAVINDVEAVNLESYKNRFYFENADVKVSGAIINKIAAENSKVEIKNLDIKLNGTTNGLHIKNSEVSLDSVYVESKLTEDNYPAVWIGKRSEVTIKNSTIDQEGYTAALCPNNSSKITVQDSKVTSISSYDSKVIIKDSHINAILSINDYSYIKLLGDVEFLGENDKKIDILVTDNSVLTGDKIILNRKFNPNIRISKNSHMVIKELAYDGDINDIKIEDNEGTSFHNLTKKNVLIPNGENNIEEPGAALEQLNELVGLKKVKREIDKMLRQVDFNNKRIEQGLRPEKQDLHSVFVGNPGTGKTTVARLIGRILFEKGALSGEEFVFIEASESDLVSSNVGQTAIQTQKLLEKARGGVLFIDEAYTLNKKGRTVDFGIEAINTILKFMEDYRDEIMIIFAGYTKEMEQFLKTNPGLASRVPNTFDFEDYTPDEIVLMGEKILAKGNYVLEDKEYYAKNIKREYKASLDKSNGRWIRNINGKIVKSLAARVIESGDDDIVTIKNVDIDDVVNQDAYENNKDSRDAMVELEKLVGIPKVKEQIGQFIAMAEVNKKREEQGYDVSSTSLHSLFLGNPGTGKTTVARLLGEIMYQKGLISKKRFVEASRSDLVGGYIGHTAMKTREVLESALGGVLFIDEAYTLNPKGSSDFSQEAIDEILKFMEDHRGDIVIIFAGYTKEMGEFIKTNSGLQSRIPTSFDFEDYTDDEIVEIGLLGLDKSGYELDRELYANVVKELYRTTNDRSNGRWIRNLNEKLIMYMSTRVSRDENENINLITQEDIEMLKEDYNGK